MVEKGSKMFILFRGPNRGQREEEPKISSFLPLDRKRKRKV